MYGQNLWSSQHFANYWLSWKSHLVFAVQFARICCGAVFQVPVVQCKRSAGIEVKQRCRKSPSLIPCIWYTSCRAWWWDWISFCFPFGSLRSHTLQTVTADMSIMSQSRRNKISSSIKVGISQRTYTEVLLDETQARREMSNTDLLFCKHGRCLMLKHFTVDRSMSPDSTPSDPYNLLDSSGFSS